MRLSRKPAAASLVALAALLMLSSLGLAATSWGGRTYSQFGVSTPGTTGMLAMSGPSFAAVRVQSAVQASSSESLAGFSFAAPGKQVQLCPDPCYGNALGVNGTVTGLGNATGDAVRMEAETVVLIQCTNQGGTSSPGRNLLVMAADNQTADDAFIDSKGRFFFTSDELRVTGDEIGFTIGTPLLPASSYGCSNDNWTATVAGFQFLCAKLSAVHEGVAYSSVLDKFSASCSLTL